jgi:hypothetical protein
MYLRQYIKPYVLEFGRVKARIITGITFGAMSLNLAPLASNNAAGAMFTIASRIQHCRIITYSDQTLPEV